MAGKSYQIQLVLSKIIRFRLLGVRLLGVFNFKLRRKFEMKKFTILALAAVLVVAFTVPVMAMEYNFGGYWRTRAWTQQNFTGEDRTELEDVTAVDTRTRLYFTAVFNENLKFVNKFEFDAVWGDTNDPGKNTYADIGADGKHVEIKNSYADFTMGPVNAKVGVQGATLARGFLFSDDFAGAVVTFKGPGFAVPLIWIKSYEGSEYGSVINDKYVGRLGHNNKDVDYYAISPSFSVGDMLTINPFAMYANSTNARGWRKTNDFDLDGDPSTTGIAFDNLDVYYGGINLDANFGMASFWLTGIYQGGEGEIADTNNSTVDFAAYLGAAGFGLDFGAVGVHGQAFYATGDDDAADDEVETFFVPKGQSYYWAEIMGFGDLGDVYWGGVSKASPADQIGNIFAANIGATFKPMDKLTIKGDVWYAALAEDIVLPDGSEENQLGVEADLKISYQLVDGLTLDLIGAYLFAGDATTMGDPDEADPYEVGSRLSLSF